MSQVPIFKYPLDLTGNHPGNLVTYELVELGTTVGNRTIVPKYGAFYAKSMKIRQTGHNIDANALSNVLLTGPAPLHIPVPGDNDIVLTDVPDVVQYVNLSNQLISTENGLYTYVVDVGGAYTLTKISPGTELTPGTDYKSFMLNQDATRMSGGQFVDQLLVLTNETVQGYLILEYQAVGGIFSVAADVLQLLVNQLELDNRPVNWHDIVELPPGFNPVPHYHHSSEFFGYGGLIAAIERMSLAVLSLTDPNFSLNRKVFPPIIDYAGPVYSTDVGNNESKVSDGSILTYLGKIVPRTFDTNDSYQTNEFKVSYMTMEYMNNEFSSVEGDLIISFSRLQNHNLEIKDVIKSGTGHSSSQFLTYIAQHFDIDLNLWIVDAIYLFELSKNNRASLILGTDEPSDIITFSDGTNRVTVGVTPNIVFDTITLPVSGTQPSQFIIDPTGVISNISQINDVFQQFTIIDEDENILLSNVSVAFNKMISCMNNTAQYLETKVDVISDNQFRPIYLSS